MLTLSPYDSACRWVFYIWLERILPVPLWRVLHLVKSHYYGNVRVLEIMARWEQLDCLWHNNPTLSISSASSRSISPYCIFAHPSFLYTLRFLFPDSPLKLFFTSRHLLAVQLFIIKIKHDRKTVFAVVQQCLSVSSISVHLQEIVLHPAAICCC